MADRTDRLRTWLYNESNLSTRWILKLRLVWKLAFQIQDFFFLIAISELLKYIIENLILLDGSDWSYYFLWRLVYYQSKINISSLQKKVFETNFIVYKNFRNYFILRLFLSSYINVSWTQGGWKSQEWLNI